MRGHLLAGNVPNWVLGQGGVNNIPATIDFDFLNERYYQSGQLSNLINLLTTVRTGTATDLLPTSASGFTYNSFPANVPRITPGLGLLVEEARTNLFLNSTAPVTQTITVGVGTFVTWVNGSGSITTAAGTAVGSGFGAATQGTTNVIVITTGGTVTFTKAGSLNAVQVEQIGTTGTFGTSLIITAGASVARAMDSIKITTVPTFGGSYTGFIKALTGVAGTLTGLPTGMEMAATASPSTNRLTFYNNNTAATILVNNVINVTMASWAASTIGCIAGSFTTTSERASFNGGAIVTGANALPSAIQNLYIGRQNGGTVLWNSYIQRIAYWPTINQPDSFLKFLSGSI